MSVIEKIEVQQQGIEDSAPWTVGEHLKDICRSDPHCAEIVAQDLENPSMSIVECEKKIKAYADSQHRSGNFVGVPPHVAERIIREFYGLPAAGEQPKLTLMPANGTGSSLDFDLMDLL